jgi:molybdopterin-synthase adenylyltransferase
MWSDNTQRERSVVLTETLHHTLESQLLQGVRRNQRQEYLCLALYRTTRGAQRDTAVVFEMVAPMDGELVLEGNVGYQPAYLERVIDLAREQEAGVVVLHNHFTNGWQGMSEDDVRAEQGRAGWVLAGTGLPLIGMTIGTDGAWSARFWVRIAPRTFKRCDCLNVRVVGRGLKTTFHPTLKPAPRPSDELRRPISVWGSENQANLARLHVAVIGLGSVGSFVAEGLARMGIECVTFIDFDRLELHNLDKTLGARRADAENNILKVTIAERNFLEVANAEQPHILAHDGSITDTEGARLALDCDVVFSCVDRPWGRHVLNYIAFTHLIPVIDGGILFRSRNGKPKGADWSVRTVTHATQCLACAGAYATELVETDRMGLYDDPNYVQSLNPDDPIRRNENIFAFSAALAAQELQHFIALGTRFLNLENLGEQKYHYNTRELEVSEDNLCRDGCAFPSMTGTGETIFQLDQLTRARRASPLEQETL